MEGCPVDISALLICEPCGEGHGLFLPRPGSSEQYIEPRWIRGIMYGFFLSYSFLGVAIIADVFMGAIESITARRKQLIDKAEGKRSTGKVWNDTVATLSLMALGSSAPEIAISVVDLFKKGFHFSDLGPATIVGSAAFNLLVIIAVCIAVIPSSEVRIIAELPAFYITAAFSLFAYVWLAFILAFTSKDRVEVWEAVATFLQLPLLIWIAWKFDTGVPQEMWRKFRGIEEEQEDGGGELPIILFDGPHHIEVPGSDEEQTIEVNVIINCAELQRGIKCTYRTEGLTAIADVDFEMIEGELEWAAGPMQPVSIALTINPKRMGTIDSDFVLFLEEAEGGDFDEETDGCDEATILTVTVKEREGGSASAKRFDKLMRTSTFRRGRDEWLDQIRNVLYVNGSLEEQSEASIPDWILHILCIPWRVFFLIVPPTDFFGGWLSFWSSLVVIGFLIIIVSDLAELFGCVLGIPNIITALTFVALGTSMPDLFASLTAAREDPTADASIVNVTGSNSVNVYLGLGVPWTIGSVYWNLEGRTADWEMRYVGNPKFNTDFEGAAFMVESGNIVFTVWMFSCACIAALGILYLRRKYLGCELGGPYFPKTVVSGTFICFWCGFVIVCAWRSMRWEASTWLELCLVMGPVGLAEAVLAIWSAVVIYRYRGERWTGESENGDDEQANSNGLTVADGDEKGQKSPNGGSDGRNGSGERLSSRSGDVDGFDGHVGGRRESQRNPRKRSVSRALTGLLGSDGHVAEQTEARAPAVLTNSNAFPQSNGAKAAAKAQEPSSTEPVTTAAISSEGITPHIEESATIDDSCDEWSGI